MWTVMKKPLKLHHDKFINMTNLLQIINFINREPVFSVAGQKLRKGEMLVWLYIRVKAEIKIV